VGMTAFTTGADRSELISVERRISSGHSWGVSFILVVLAGYLALAVPPAFAQSPCPAGVSPYALPSASDRACGIQLIPRHAVTPLPGGGERTEYLLPSGEIILSTTPPPSFDAAAASPAELQEYGIPSEPAATSPEYPQWRAMIENGIHGVEPPAELAISTPESNAAPGITSLSSTNASSSEPSTGSYTWSGYFDWYGRGSYTHTAAYFTEPQDNNFTPCTKPNNQGSIWGGIGGWETGNNGPLGQDGTVQHQEKHGEDEAFFEVLPAIEASTGFKSTPRAYFLADTHWTGSKYSFYFYNYANGQSKHFELGGTFNGKTADFIAERQRGTNLYNFGTIHFQGFTNGKAFHEKGGYPTERLTMSNVNEVNAEPSQVYKNYEFTDKWLACAGETLAKEEEQSGSGEGAEPVATTGSSTSIGEHEATLGGTVNPEGTVTHYQFEYGTEAGNFSSSTPDVSAGSGASAVPVSAKVTGLQPGTTYHYRIIANSATGISAGTEATFTTTGHPPLPPPTVTTEGASAITAHATTLEATVNPNGLDTHYYFEYGTNPTLYESDAPALPGNDAGSGSVPVHVSVGATSLAPYTTYYYRVVASNSTGTSYGTEQKFTTLATGTFSAGAYHTCALVSGGGGIDCWGYNYDGELGNGTTKNISTKPVAVSGIASASEVRAGGYHTCALLSGSIDCWGYNKFGELGNGTTTGSATPVAVSGITNAIEVSGGDFYTCALLSGGGIDCWGENGFGELGDGTFTERTTPVAVHGITNATEVTAGALSTCALLSGGSIDCWGYNGFGELGTGSTVPEYSPTPVAVKGITNAVAVSAVGDFYTCALLSGGTIKCWGDNEDGELGNGTTVNSSTPVQVTGITSAAGVVAGAFHTCAWLVAATAYCWGENYFGELGNGTTVNSSTPVQVSGITSAAGVTAGTSHTCARLIGGSIDCWGENLDGQLGNGTTTNSSTPVAVSGLP
jgi:alpha-tubulin suppressor-like RCC1 family protein